MDTGQSSGVAVAGKRKRRRTERYPAAVKCTAERRDGQPCGRLALRGAHVCGVHGGQLPNVREAAARTVEDARTRLKLLHDPAVDTLADLLEDRDPRVRLGAVGLLHKVSPLESQQQGGGNLTLVLSPSVVIRQRLDALRAAQQRPAPSTEPEALPWDGEPVEGMSSTLSQIRGTQIREADRSDDAAPVDTGRRPVPAAQTGSRDT